MAKPASAFTSFGAWDEDPELCPRCKCCSTEWEDCFDCHGERGRNRHEEDPLQFAPNDWRRCDWCGGRGGAYWCGGSCDDQGRHEAITRVRAGAAGGAP